MSAYTPNNNTAPKPTSQFDPTTELLDLGGMRFEKDTAAPSDRDTALFRSASHTAHLPRAAHAPRGLEGQMHEWTTFEYTADAVDLQEKLKGDLHGGQLHRANRVARGEDPGVRFGGRVMGVRGGGQVQDENVLCAGRKGEKGGIPTAKGMAEEMDKSMFWEERII